MSRYIDGNFDTPHLIDYARYDIVSGIESRAIDQVYVQRKDLYVPMVLLTESEIESDHFLIEESKPESIGGNLVRFTRTFCSAINSYRNPMSYAYAYPGRTYLVDAPQGVTYSGPSQVAGSTESTAKNIVATQEFTFWLTVGGSNISVLEPVYFGTNDQNYTFIGPVPASANYQGQTYAWVQDPLKKWSQRKGDANLNGWVAECSISQVRGALWQRRVVYVPPNG